MACHHALRYAAACAAAKSASIELLRLLEVERVTSAGDDMNHRRSWAGGCDFPATAVAFTQ
jgi:hypothetical protein